MTATVDVRLNTRSTPHNTHAPHDSRRTRRLDVNVGQRSTWRHSDHTTNDRGTSTQPATNDLDATRRTTDRDTTQSRRPTATRTTRDRQTINAHHDQPSRDHPPGGGSKRTLSDLLDPPNQDFFADLFHVPGHHA